MTHSRASSRGVVIVEDKLTERFFRHLLERLGFDRRRLRFFTAPSGRGAAEAWVGKRYGAEVRVLRSKNFQQDLFLVAVRDGDRVGLAARKHELDEQLRAEEQEPREATERIATPVPTWSIETWLLHLTKAREVVETASLKEEFKAAFRGREHQAIRAAVDVWSTELARQLASLSDGHAEVDRLYPE